MNPHEFRPFKFYREVGGEPVYADWCAHSENFGLPDMTVCGNLVTDPIHSSSAMVTCNLCNTPKPLVLLVEHMQDVHGIDETIQTWPDGSPVIIDTTLEPKDFG